MNLGVTVDIMKSIIERSDVVIAQVNRHMPVTRGDTRVHVSEVDYIVEHDEPLVNCPVEAPDPEVMEVGKNIGRLIEDGSTIQIGFGRIPEAAMGFLKTKKNLSIHSEIITDPVVDLAASGAVRRSKDRGRTGTITASLCIGSGRLFQFVHDNPLVEMRSLSDVVAPATILCREKFVAVNGAVEIDLTGQSCVAIGDRTGYFGSLGHAVFNRTAMFSPGGKGIIALRSTSRDGSLSRIVPEFTDRRIGIVTTQTDVNYVVTEYGFVNLFGKSIRERALALITIAHPKFRQWLLEEAKRMNYVYEDQHLPPDCAPYPGSYERSFTFGGGSLLIRPVRVTDERAIQNLFYAMSRDDRFHRFLMHVSSLHHKQAQNLMAVDYTSSLALVVQNGEGMRQEGIIALAHIAPEENAGARRVCEFAVMVEPSWQNRGIGTFLLQSMIAISREMGYSRVRAYVWEENKQMLKVFEKLGCSMTQELQCHVYRVNIEI
jgi:RimJ/RimL family protein N-acetyltransferase